MLNQALLVLCLTAATSVVVSAKEQQQVEYPDVLDRSLPIQSCDENAIVAAWCDSRVLTDLECGILTPFDQ